MENIAKTPGLLHIAEKIFLQLNYEDLMAWHLDLCNSAKIGQLDLIKILAPWTNPNLETAGSLKQGTKNKKGVSMMTLFFHKSQKWPMKGS